MGNPLDIANQIGFDLTEVADEALDGLSIEQQRDLVLARLSALRAWADDLDRRGFW
jgi:hypothetical protein